MLKKAAKLLSAVLCASLFFTGCSKAEMREMMDSFSSKKVDTELKKDVFSKKYKYQITVPESWEEVNSQYNGALPEGNDIIWAEATDIDAALQVSIGSSSYVGFDAYFGTFIKNLNDEMSENVSRADFSEKDINGYKVQYIELSDITVPGKSDDKFKIWVYCMDDEKGIVIFESLMRQEEATEEMHDMIESVVCTFKKF